MANTFQINSQTSSAATTQPNEWEDFGPSLDFTAIQAGVYLVTLNIGGVATMTGNDKPGEVRVVATGSLGFVQPEPLTFVAAGAGPPVLVSYQCLVMIQPTAGGTAKLTPQWRAGGDGLRIAEGTLCTLSAVGSLQMTKVLYDDVCHYEKPKLFSRGLLLTGFTETLIVSGYSASPGDAPHPACDDSFPLNMTPPEQMQWIVDRLDRYFTTIPYADGTGYYSKYDVVYFDLCIDKTVSDPDQDDVLNVLEAWFADVSPKPSTGILKKVEALAFPSIQVEIEFILAH